MHIRLHKNARTTPTTRTEIAASPVTTALLPWPHATTSARTPSAALAAICYGTGERTLTHHTLTQAFAAHTLVQNNTAILGVIGVG